MKTVIVTGAGGFVASHLIDLILEKTNWNIIGIDSFAHRGDPMRLEGVLADERLHLITADLTTPLPKRLKSKIMRYEPWAIINTASESHVDRSITDAVPFVQNNVSLQLQVLELAKWLGIRRFIQCSTDEVFGPALPGQAHREWSDQLPSNPYAASKAAQDALCIAYWRTYGIPMTITHTMNMIGERQDPEKFVPLVIAKIMAGETVQIHGTESFIGSRFYLHARCLADAWIWLLEQPDELVAPAYHDSESEILRPAKFNVVGECEIDNLTLAMMIAEKIGKPLYYELVNFHSARPGHDRRYALDGEKIALLGWQHPMLLDESIDRIIEFYLNPKNQYWLMPY